MLTLLLLLQDGAAIQRFQEAWPRQDFEALAPLAKDVVDAGEKLDVYRQRWVVDVLLRAGDLERLKTLETTSRFAREVEGERLAAGDDLEACVAFLDGLKPFRKESTAFEFFAERLHKSGRISAFVERLMKTPAEHADFPHHKAAIQALPWGYFKGDLERNELFVRLTIKEKGEDAVTHEWWLILADNYATEKRFVEARAAALKAQKYRYPTPAQEAGLWRVLAICHLETGELAAAHAACAEGMKASKLATPAFHLLKARVFLAGGDDDGALKAWSEALAGAGAWETELWFAQQIKELLAHRPVAVDGGDPFVIAAARELAGDLAGAARALEARKTFAAALERTRLRISSKDWAKAVAAHLEALPFARKETRKVERVETAEKALIEGCEKAEAWDALKALGRGLAAEPGRHRSELEKILEAVCEPEYLVEIERIGLAAATKPMERGWAVQPVILAAHRLGWHEEAERRLLAVTCENGFEGVWVDIAKSWLEDFARPENRDVEPLAEARRRLLERGDHPDALRNLTHLGARLDRAWKARVRMGREDGLVRRLAALRSSTPEERIAWAEEILREPGTSPTWAAYIGEILLARDDDRPAIDFYVQMLRVPERRTAALESLLPRLHEISRAERLTLIRALDAIDACGWAWDLGKEMPASILERVELLERWWRRAAGTERAEAARRLAPVLEAGARQLRGLGRDADAALLLERAAEIGEGADVLRCRLDAATAWAAAGNARAALRSCRAARGQARDVLLRASELPGFWPAVRELSFPALPEERREALRRTLDRLRDDDLEGREKAAEAIRAFGTPAVPLLLDASDDPDLEYRGRIRRWIIDALSLPE